jgi:hypothetical protein
MAGKSKAYKAAHALLTEGHYYQPGDAVALAKKTTSSSFDSTVEVALNSVKQISLFGERSAFPTEQVKSPALSCSQPALLPKRRLPLEPTRSVAMN